MSSLHIYLTLAIFLAVIILIAFDVLDMMVAAMLGASLMAVFGLFDRKDIQSAADMGGPVLSLLFGGMVVAHVLGATGLFDRLTVIFLKATGGSGKRFLFLLLLVVSVVCAVLPNATTVILLAPVIIGVAKTFKVSFVGPMILAALVSNSAGLLTLVGDPATYIVGNSIGMTFAQYLKNVSLGGVFAVLAVIPLLPWLMREVWQAKIKLPSKIEVPKIQRPGFALFAFSVLALMVFLFLIGENLPTHIVPPAVAIIAASLALLAVYSSRVEAIESVLHHIDWRTLVFLAATFFLVQAVIKTNILLSLSVTISRWFGPDVTSVALLLLVGIGALSSVLANTPVVAASIIMTKGYLVAAELVPEQALGPDFTDWPTATLPAFIGMMFGGTLGGNATLIGAAANIVAAGICVTHHHRISFAEFGRYGLPVAACQLTVSAIYLLAYSWLAR